MEIIKPLKLNHLVLLVGAGLEKKGDSNMKVSQYKLLKTNIEKMSDFRPVYMFMKNNELKSPCVYIVEN